MPSWTKKTMPRCIEVSGNTNGYSPRGPMKTVITYGTFDLLHNGHVRLLERARALGDRLIVGVTSDRYDLSRGKLNVSQTVEQRIANVERLGLADMIVVEDYEGQKIEDIQTHKVDLFVIGSDWQGRFDYLSEWCEVIYLERTRHISSTLLREQNGIIQLGVAGTGRIARRFIAEARHVSGLNVRAVFSHQDERATTFAQEQAIEQGLSDYDAFLQSVDAVYIASSHPHHYAQARRALMAHKHVLVEKPAVLDPDELEALITLAQQHRLTFMEGIKTAYAPAFTKLLEVARSGVIGSIKDVSAAFTKLVPDGTRELSRDNEGGSINELGSYPLLPIIKLLGAPSRLMVQAITADNGIDTYAKIHCQFARQDHFATATTGLKVKREGDLVIAGTRGYLYVPAPWWITSEFEARFENVADNKRYYYRFDGDGLRYELAEFCRQIRGEDAQSPFLTHADSMTLCRLLHQARQ